VAARHHLTRFFALDGEHRIGHPEGAVLFSWRGAEPVGVHAGLAVFFAAVGEQVMAVQHLAHLRAEMAQQGGVPDVVDVHHAVVPAGMQVQRHGRQGGVIPVGQVTNMAGVNQVDLVALGAVQAHQLHHPPCIALVGWNQPVEGDDQDAFGHAISAVNSIAPTSQKSSCGTAARGSDKCSKASRTSPGAGKRRLTIAPRSV
jgi:hypothetical protein